MLRAEAPGFEPGDFDLQIRGNQITVRAEHKQETRSEQGSEFSCGTLFRSFPLPAGVDQTKIEAQYRNGVLEVRFPKTPEARGKRIPVQTD